MADKVTVPASTVREWARKKGLQVGTRGHIHKDVVDAFNRAHRAKEYVNTNPWLHENKAS